MMEESRNKPANCPPGRTWTALSLVKCSPAPAASGPAPGAGPLPAGPAVEPVRGGGGVGGLRSSAPSSSRSLPVPAPFQTTSLIFWASASFIPHGVGCLRCQGDGGPAASRQTWVLEHRADDPNCKRCSSEEEETTHFPSFKSGFMDAERGVWLYPPTAIFSPSVEIRLFRLWSYCRLLLVRGRVYGSPEQQLFLQESKK